MTTATIRSALARYKVDVRSRFRPVRFRAGQRFIERIGGRYYRSVDPTVASIREGLAAWLGRWEQSLATIDSEALGDSLAHIWGLQGSLEHADDDPPGPRPPDQFQDSVVQIRNQENIKDVDESSL